MKKRILSIILTLSMVLGICPTLFLSAPVAQAATLSGSGTEEDPYLITSVDDIKTIYSGRSAGTYRGCFEITNDIDMTGCTTPLQNLNAVFAGNIDGKGHVIRGLTSPLIPKYSCNSESKYIKNLTIYGNITGKSTTYLGGLISYMEMPGTASTQSTKNSVRFENCHFVGSVQNTNTSSAARVMGTGGLIGSISYTWVFGRNYYLDSIYVRNCSVQGTIQGKQYVGGIIGDLYDAPVTVTIEKSYFVGTAKNTRYDYSWHQQSGLLGKISSGTELKTLTLSDCYYKVESEMQICDGVSDAIPKVNIERCYAYYPAKVALRDYTVSDAYYLADTHTDAENNQTGLTAEEFKDSANFNNFDFTDTWEMSAKAGRPLLKNNVEPLYPQPDITDSVSVTAAEGVDKAIDLASYIVDKSGNSLTDQYTLSISQNEQITLSSTGQSGNLATISGTKIGLNGGAKPGEHTIKVKGTYTGDKLDPATNNDFTITITLTVTKTVPNPVASETTLSYSPYTRLSDIDLNDNWQWAEPNTVPKTTGNYTVVYPVPTGKQNYYIYGGTAGKNYNASYGGITATVKLTVNPSDETPYKITITVKNDDTGAVIPNATVLSGDPDLEFPDGYKTNASGQVVGEMTAGLHTVDAWADGFIPASGDVTIETNNANKLTIFMLPERYDVSVPAIYDEDGNEVNTKATVTKLDGAANKWTEGGTTAGYEGGTTQQMPKGTYEVDLSAYGYSDQTVYLVVGDDGSTDYYESYDSSTGKVSGKITNLAEKLTSEALGDAVYNVELERDLDARTITATVTLKGVKVTSGTFGMRYDTDLFTFSDSDVTWNAAKNIQLAGTPEMEYKAAIENLYDEDTANAAIPAWNAANGYYIARWSVGDDSDADGAKQVLDTETEATEIVKLVFHAKDGVDLETDLTRDSLGIIPWQDTFEAKAYKTWYDAEFAGNPEAEGQYRFEEYWRPVDDENIAGNLSEGRIEASQAIVDGDDTKGFYEVTVNGSSGGSTLASLYDVKTVMDYQFDLSRTALKFVVVDGTTGNPVGGATVKLYPEEGAAAVEETNSLGVAKFLIDLDTDYDVAYGYSVESEGYWPIPTEGDNPSVLVTPGVAKTVDVEIYKKVYHVPVLKGVGDSEDPESIAIVANTDLGGERLGYNGINFHFRAKAGDGYKISSYPESATVTIKDGETVLYSETIEPDGDRLFTLGGEHLDQSELSPAKLLELYGAEEGKNSVDDYAQPDEDGFRSYNIEITFNAFDVERKYVEVRGIAGTNGVVSYDATIPDGSKEAVEVTKNHEYVVENIEPDNNTVTGTFVFDADDDYMVEKVFINGIQVHDYDNKDQFSYSFGQPTIDCAIVVTFWDGERPSEDSIVTLVVGGFGEVDVTAPDPNEETGFREQGIRETRRVYVNPDPNVAFTAKPDQGYQLCEVETQVDDGARMPYDLSGFTEEELKAPNTQDFAFAPVKGKNETIYVTFKNPKADRTPTVFVKSYVERGDGDITPFGLLVYNVYDTVRLGLASEYCDAWGVKVSPYGEPENGVETPFATLARSNTYVIDSIRESAEVGAIFEEHTYVVTGKVDLAQGLALSDTIWNLTNSTAIRSGATVTFVRTADPQGNKLDDNMTVKAATTASRKDAAFSVDIPVGTWNIIVSKQGYVNYIITGYVFDPTEEQKQLDSIEFSSKTITPYIGSTTDGTGVTVIDIGGVRSGLRDNISAELLNKADVDNNGTVDIADMTFVLKNFGRRTNYQTIDAFESN